VSRPLIRLLFLGDPRTDRRIKNFIDFFSRSGYQIELVVSLLPNKKDDNFTIENAKVIWLPLSYSSGAKMFLEHDKLLLKYLSGAPPCDILLACELYSLKGAAKAKKAQKTSKLFYDARELYTELPTVNNSPLKKYFWKRWEAKGLKETDLVIVTAPDDADAIRQVHSFLPEFIVIRNLPLYEEIYPNNYLREYFSIPSDKKILVYVGGLQRDRGLDSIIAIMHGIKDIAVFIMIGDGAIKRKLEERTNELHLENVFFHPSIESEKIVSIISSADVGVSLIEAHSKSYELALPSKVFEYMLAGLPVISSPLKQVINIFEHSEGIFFANPDNPEEVVKACTDALNLSTNSSLRQNLHHNISKNYTFDNDANFLSNYLQH
jgi:glycosyltransferase involved in cell wall biosynthesis